MHRDDVGNATRRLTLPPGAASPAPEAAPTAQPNGPQPSRDDRPSRSPRSLLTASRDGRNESRVVPLSTSTIPPPESCPPGIAPGARSPHGRLGLLVYRWHPCRCSRLVPDLRPSLSRAHWLQHAGMPVTHRAHAKKVTTTGGNCPCRLQGGTYVGRFGKGLGVAGLTGLLLFGFTALPAAEDPPRFSDWRNRST